MYEQAEPTASAHPADSIDFEADGSPPAPDVDLPDLLRRFRSLDLRVRVLEAERSGAQQARWHHHRAAFQNQRLRSLISPWAFMSSKVDTLRTRLQTVASRLATLLLMLQQSFPSIAHLFTDGALDTVAYQGPVLDGSDIDTAA